MKHDTWCDKHKQFCVDARDGKCLGDWCQYEDTVAKRIRAYRGKESQEHLAERLGVSRSLVKSWETGYRRVAKVEHINRLASAFNASASEFVEW